MFMDPSQVEAVAAVGLGLAFAGLLGSGFEWLAKRPVSFTLLQQGGARALGSVPVVVFSAPFIILRNTVRGRRFERRKMRFVMMATIIAGGWSLLSGRLVLDLVMYLAGV